MSSIPILLSKIFISMDLNQSRVFFKKQQQKALPEVKKDRKECLVYLRNHADEIVPLNKRNLPFFHFCSLGSMESNVGKLVAQRMKTRGCSWRKDGAKGMLAILRHQSELTQHVFRYKDIQISTQKKILKRYKQPSEYGTIPHGSFPILNSGKISSPYASLFKAIIDIDLPL